MNLADAEPALTAWIASLTGITAALVVWENAPRPQFDTQLATCSWVSSAPRGVAGVTYEYDDEPTDPRAQMIPTQRGESVEVMQVQILSLDQRPGYNASALARQVVERCRMPGSIAALRAVNLGLQGVESYRLADRKVDGIMASVAVVEMRFNTTSAYRSTAAGDTTSFIESVQYTSTIPGASGVALPATIAPGGTIP